MIYAAKILFCLFLAILVGILLTGHVNGDRAFALAVVVIACVCQMLFGPSAEEKRRNKSEVLVFRPIGGKR